MAATGVKAEEGWQSLGDFLSESEPNTLADNDPEQTPASIPVRREVSTMAFDDPTLETFREGIRQMLALPRSDPWNWYNIARIHEEDPRHNSWFFLPWHRAYLHMFEEACRVLTGDTSFALPYWDWTRNPGAPSQFYGANNPLDISSFSDQDRAASAGTPMPSEAVGQRVMDRILSENNFELFAGTPDAAVLLEQRPHNQVHVIIGGVMASYSSPLDALFWAHHANVDRLWSLWNANGHSNTSSQSWLSETFRNQFVNADRQLIDVRVSDTQDTRQMNYVYEGIEPLDGTRGSRRMRSLRFSPAARGSNRQPSRLDQVTTIPIDLGASSFRFDPVSFSGSSGKRLLLRLGDITPPATEADMMVDVYLNASNLASASRGENAAHLAGSFSFYSISPTAENSGSGHHAHHQASFLLDITDTAKQLANNGRFDTRQLDVQLLPRSHFSGNGRRSDFTVGQVELQVADS